MTTYQIKYEDGILIYKKIEVTAESFGDAENRFNRTIGYKRIISIKAPQ
jgi:hypothetical protein|tara:strand:- start:272 stop:418 length:147 start_codon:yes stop_codon:yes gene_type:complete